MDAPRYKLALDLRAYWEDHSLAVLQIVNVGSEPVTNYKGLLQFFPEQTGPPEESRDVLLPLVMPGERFSIMIDPANWDGIKLSGSSTMETLPDSTILAAAIWEAQAAAEVICDNQLPRVLNEVGKLSEAMNAATFVIRHKNMPVVAAPMLNRHVHALEVANELAARPWWRRLFGRTN